MCQASKRSTTAELSGPVVLATEMPVRTASSGRIGVDPGGERLAIGEDLQHRMVDEHAETNEVVDPDRKAPVPTGGSNGRIQTAGRAVQRQMPDVNPSAPDPDDSALSLTGKNRQVHLGPGRQPKINLQVELLSAGPVKAIPSSQLHGGVPVDDRDVFRVKSCDFRRGREVDSSAAPGRNPRQGHHTRPSGGDALALRPFFLDPAENNAAT